MDDDCRFRAWLQAEYFGPPESMYVAVNNVMVVRDHGSDEQWAAKCAAQQRALIESDSTSPRTIEASTTHQDEPLALPEPPAICDPADRPTVASEPVPVPIAPSWTASAHQTPAPYYGPPTWRARY